MKVSELHDVKLDYWVAKVIGESVVEHPIQGGWTIRQDEEWPMAYFPLPEYSSDWSQCGPLIEKYKVTLEPGAGWFCSPDKWLARIVDDRGETGIIAETPQIAICRCIVASKYGDEVEDEQN